jgi:hypothetical protein
MVHGGNLLRSENGGFATYECKSSRDVQWSDPQWIRSGQTEVCRIREIMLLGRQLSVANKRIKRLEEALDKTSKAACKHIKQLESEVYALRLYGNKDCTAMADQALKEAKP